MTNFVVDDVRAALDRAAEPGSSEGIAEFFRKRHIYGATMDYSRCIIACYLRAEVDGVGYVKVLGGMVGIADDQWWVPLPAELIRFTNDFDLYVYPELVDEGVAWPPR